MQIPESLKRSVPWYIKIPLKCAIARLPFGDRFWQRLNVFRAGGMDDPANALTTLEFFLRLAGLPSLAGRTILELGPGNSLLTALFAASLGSEGTWLVDVKRLAETDVSLFAKAIAVLEEKRMPVPNLDGCRSTPEIMKKLRATYETGGIESLSKIADASVDFIFSAAVLQHVRLDEFPELLRQTRRILKPEGVAAHTIDFRDHLQRALNNLRFSERVWESSFMANSGFYTNRIPWPQMKQMFEDCGFLVEVKHMEFWPHGLPTQHHKMAMPFKEMPIEDLLVSACQVVLRPQPDGVGQGRESVRGRGVTTASQAGPGTLRSRTSSDVSP
jgi:SAM-dependent methyltransferase